MAMTDDAIGQWMVDVNETEDAVHLEFSHVELHGVETFVTALLPEDAVALAVAILEAADGIS